MNQRDVASVIVGGNRVNLRPSLPEADISGKGSIFVSSRGISNGTSDKINNGADFGVDTPGTTSDGISEAIKLQYITGRKIELDSGIFNISGQCPLHASTYIEGKGMGNTTIRLLTSGSGNDAFPFSINGVYRVILKNIEFDANNTTWNSLLNFSTVSEGSYLNVLENVRSKTSTAGNLTYDFILDHMEDTICINVFANKISWQANGGNTKFFGGIIGTYTAAFQNTILSGTTIDDCIIIASTTNPSIMLMESVYFNGPSSSSFFMATTQPVQIIIVGGWLVDNQNAGSPYPVFALQTVTSATVYLKLLTCYFNVINLGTSFVAYPMFASGITGYAELDLVFSYGGTPGAWNDYNSFLSRFRTISAFNAVTPSVPASGTAYKNTTNSPMNIYITATGTVSAYTITDTFGNAVSFSTALSVGQVIRLDPGAEITLTYSAAPSWKFYGE